MQRKLIYLSYLLIYLTEITLSKYLEGELHTSENWAFIARFCFLSEEGQFEYYIEYGEDQGEPNLLLYYDTEDQWSAVYKTDKKCLEKEEVLKVGQNQIINLTSIYPWRDASGCTATPTISTQAPRYTVKVPTGPSHGIKRKTTTRSTPKTTPIAPKLPLTDIPSTIIAKNNTITQEVTTFTPPITTTNKEIVTVLTTVDQATMQSTKTELELTTEETSTISSQALTRDSVQTSQAEKFFPAHSTETSLRKKRYVPHNIKYFRGNRTVVCTNARRFRSSRERWWFIAISNCNGAKGIHIKYKILMTNGAPGDYWHEHFSADEFYVLPVLMAFSVAYSFLILAIVICSIELKSRQLLHSTYKLFVFSAIVQFLGILFRTMCYLKYAVNGVGSTGLKITGSSFMAISETTFLLLLLLLAKGYTVTRGRLPMAAGVKLTIFMCLYVVTYISLFIYETQVFDPGEVLYTYESPAGYGLIILRIIAWCMFIYSTVFTLKHYPEKANFYYPFNVFGTLWFIAGPAFIISANTYIDKWVRESVVCAVLLFITFGGHLMFLLLTMPSVANKNFPYHVRTTQIGVMEVNGLAGNSSIEQFGHHVYEPMSVDQTFIVPLTRRTEEIFGGLYSHHMHTNLQNDQIRNEQPGNDLVMNNVLSWSTAKNFSTLSAMPFERVASLRSPNIDNNFNEERQRVPSITNGEPINEQSSHAGNLNDWVKEVPVELFTISKMVVTKHDKNKTSEE